MSANAQVWALHQAKTSSATERLILYRIACAHANDDQEAELDLDDLMEYTSERESDVREALNNLARKGYLAKIKPQDGSERTFDCHLNYKLDDEYIF